MRAMEPMTLEELDRAPFRVVQSDVLRGSPERVFAELAEPVRWLGWFPLMRKAAWTSQKTACVGAERDVALRLLGRFEERFLAWEPGVRYAFTMTASTSPLARRMAEDWRLTVEGGGTRVEWIVAAHPSTLGKVGAPMLRLVTRRLFHQGMSNLTRILRERAAQVA